MRGNLWPVRSFQRITIKELSMTAKSLFSTIARTTITAMPKKTPIDYFANAFELFLSSRKRCNSAICMQWLNFP
jgi:hypothetical protein